MDKEQKSGILLSVFLMIFTYMIYKFRMGEIYSISKLINKFSNGMQIRQILASYFVFLIGYWELICAEVKWGTWRKIAFAYILGTAMWGLLSVFYLCMGIEYNLFNMICGIIGIGSFSFIWSNKKIKKDIIPFMCDSIIFFGIASLASTGLMYTFGTWDSQYYIQQWGKNFAILGSIQDIQHGLLTLTAIFPATFSSLSYFWGADNIYTIHHSLELCFWIFFGNAVSETIFKNCNYSRRIKMFITICLTVLVYRLPPVQLLSGWIISNMYMMAYGFVLCYSLFIMFKQEKTYFWDRIFLNIFVMAVTLLRSDSSVTICTILGCFAICYSDQIKNLFLFLVSAFMIFTMYYLKIFLVLRGNVDGKFISVKTILLMGICFFIVGGYMLASRYILKIIKEKYIIFMLYFCLLFFNLGLYVVFRDRYLENLYTIFKNMTDTLITGNWGNTLSITILCLFYILAKGTKKDVFFLIGVCLLVIYMDFGVIRTMDGKAIASRLGFGDSMNRAIISTLPIIFFDFYRKLFDEKDNNGRKGRGIETNNTNTMLQ